MNRYVKTVVLSNVRLEDGTVLPEVFVDYMTWGTKDESTPVAVVMHALTGTVDAQAWWPEIVGPSKFIDTLQYFTVCPRIRYETLAPYQPLLTMRDVAGVYARMLTELGISEVKVLIGGSMGGQVVLEWAVLEAYRFASIVVIAANAHPSPWSIAIRSAQRLAIEADPTFGDGTPRGGAKGLAAARAIGMVSYRSYADFQHKHHDADERYVNYSAESYQRYQAEKLVGRFSADVYYMLTRLMDSHNVGRGRGGTSAALRRIRAHAVVVGIDHDILMPPAEQHELVRNIPRVTYREMRSSVGHDAFLADQHQLASLLNELHIS